MTLSTTTIIIALLSVLAGYVTQAINTGSFLGTVTVPKRWLPYLTLLGTFLAAAVAAIVQAPVQNGAAWFNALFAGLMALTGHAAGATARQSLDAHKRSMTPVSKKSDVPVVVDAPVATEKSGPPTTTEIK